MSKKVVNTAIIPTLLVSLCTSSQGLSTDTSKNIDLEQNKKPLFEIDHIKTETVQLLELQNDPGNIMINVAGEPGVHFKIYFSTTGEEDSFKLLDNGEAVIGKNSFASLTVDLKLLGKNTVFLNMFSNDDGDFSKIGRKISEPIAISLTNNKIYIGTEDKNSTNDSNSTRVQPKKPPPTASIGVRG